ncbi:FadR/GntR family transcriptional regulator [Kribbella swartbergensis]
MTEPVASAGDALDRCVTALEMLVIEELEPGQRLPSENELAVRTGLSRVTVREALKVLSGRGLVELRRGTRAVVRDPDPSILSDYLAVAVRRDPRALLDLVEVRQALEVQAAGAAAQKATDASVRVIENAFREMELAVDASDQEMINRFHRADVAFHQALALASGNRMLAFILEGLAQVLEYSFARSVSGALARGSSFADSLESHRRVLMCIQRGDRRGASQAMRDHLKVAAANLRWSLQ